jgi:hypothetical protein
MHDICDTTVAFVTEVEQRPAPSGRAVVAVVRMSGQTVDRVLGGD